MHEVNAISGALSGGKCQPGELGLEGATQDERATQKSLARAMETQTKDAQSNEEDGRGWEVRGADWTRPAAEGGLGAGEDAAGRGGVVNALGTLLRRQVGQRLALSRPPLAWVPSEVSIRLAGGQPSSEGWLGASGAPRSAPGPVQGPRARPSHGMREGRKTQKKERRG